MLAAGVVHRGKLAGGGVGGAGWVGGFAGGIGGSGQQVAAEGGDGDCGDDGEEGGEEEPSGVEEESVGGHEFLQSFFGRFLRS